MNLIQSTEKFIQRKGFVLRLFAFPVLLVLYIFRAFYFAGILLFHSSANSFAVVCPLQSKGYVRSFAQHHTFVRQLKVGAVSSLVVSIIMSSVIGWLSSARPVQAATCNISGDTSVDQSYIDTNTCGDVHITSTATITFSGSIDLTGSSTFYVDSGVTATFSGAMSLSDANDAVIINGIVNSAAADTTGVSITAQTVTISGTGSINQNLKGCAGGASSGGDGNGPNTTTGVCALTTSGYGDGDANGAAGGGHGGAGGRASTTLTGATYDSNTAPILNGSGGGAGGVNVGAFGGGIVRLDVAGTLTVSGAISANGGDGNATSGSSRASGGGSGGSIYITAGTLAGTSTISAGGGAGGDGSTYDGGGGGGGRIAVYYNTLTTFTLANITATKGSKGGTGQTNGADGTNGTTFILDRKTDDGAGTLTIISGLDFVSGGDYARTTITAVSGAILSCGTFATLDLTTTGTLTFNGVTWTCSTVDTINITAATWTTSGTNTLTLDKSGGVVNLSITNDWTLNTTTITGGTGGTGTSGGVINLSSAINVSLVSSTINSNVNWTGLTSLNIDSGSLINANALGCSKGTATATNGYGPNTSTGVCAVSTSGYGDSSSASGAGGSHGGAGGRANDVFTGTTYGTNTGPTLLGSGGGAGNTSPGGFGGGKIRIDATGTVTINGVISANGANGATAASGTAGGGGSGGSVYITAGTVAGSSTVTAGGGNGAHSSAATSDGGGGGGGRVAVYYATLDTFSVSNATATKGTKGGTATNAADGVDGTVYTLQYTVPTAPTISTPTAAATGQSRNIALASSAYASNGAAQTFTDWQISDNDTFSDSDCSDTNIVWCKHTATNLASITVNATDGNFQNALSGKTLLAANTTYYVRVRYVNVAGNSTWSSSVSFTTTTNTVPATPTNSSPADAATGVSKNPTLTASAFSDTNGDAHASSTWSVYESSTCAGTADWSKSVDASNLTSITVNTTNGTFADALVGQTTLKAHTVYSFQVVYTDDQSGASTASTCTSFTTTNNTPVLDSSVPTQTLIEDTNSTGAFDLDTYISDADFNDDDQYNCSASDGFSAALGTMTINGNRTIDFALTANANGSDTIQFSCADGASASVSTNSITVNVTAVNDTPSFTKGSNQTVLEDAGATTTVGWATSISAGPTDESGQTQTFTLTATDTSLFSTQPAVNSSTGTLTYTPAANANGSTNVSISVADSGGTANGGSNTSGTQTFTITLTGVNDAPSFTKGSNQTVLEDSGVGTAVSWATAMSSGPSDEAAQTTTFTATATDTSLFSVQPAINSTTGTLTYTPASNANGSTVVTVSLADNGGTANSGSDTSASQTFTITVTAVNDVPSFTKGADQTVLEDAGAQSVTGWATALSTGPSNESAQTLTFTATAADTSLFSTQPAISGTTGNLTYTPASNTNGSTSITVSVADDGGTTNSGVDTSATQTFTITLTGVNDAPSFTKGANQTVLEDSGAATAVGWATALSSGPSDESAQTTTFTATAADTSLFSVQPAINSTTGTLTYTPAANANGSTTITVSLADNGGTANSGSDTSPTQTFTITLTAVNDTPSFTKGSNQTVLEDAGAQTATGWATALSTGPSNESGQTLTFTATAGDTSLFSTQPAISGTTGNLTYTPAANANGSTTITVSIADNGGTTNSGSDTSATQTFTITLTAVNDTPSFTKGADKSVSENAGAQTYAAWATSISTGASNESSQTLAFTTSNNNNTLFSSQPTVSSAGTLTFTPTASANGSATVSISVADNGGTTNGGVDTSATQTFTITITGVNDTPSFTKGADQTVLEDASAQSVATWATSISSGPSDESGQTVTFVVSADNTSLFSTQPAVTSGGTLSYTPAANANGAATVTVYAQDDGGTGNGGVDTSASQTFTITVTSVNDIPSFTKGGNQTVLEDAGAQTYATWATSISTGPSNESSQTLTFNVSNDNNGLFSSQPSVNTSTGTLTYTPATNANGSTTVTVSLSDNGGTTNAGVDTSASQTFTITVTSVNDTPSFTKGADQTVLEDAGAQSVATWATSISNGPSNESSQTLTFNVSNDNNGLFSSQPSVNTSTGTLTYTPATNANGSATVTALLVDDGTSTSPDSNTSASQTFTITVTAVNDAPTFAGNLPAVSFFAGTTASNVFDLNDYFSDVENDSISYGVTGATSLGVTLTDGVVSLTAPADFSGTEDLIFTATDENGDVTQSNSVPVSIAENPDNSPEVHIGDISYILGDAKGKGTVQIVGKDNTILAQWVAFSEGGVIPRIAATGGNYYVYAVKRHSGTTMHIYTLAGDIVSKDRLSAKLRWRKLAIGNLDDDKTDQEIVIGTRRDTLLFLKVFSFSDVDFTFTKKASYLFYPLSSYKYSIDVSKKTVHVVGAHGNTRLDWHPFGE